MTLLFQIFWNKNIFLVVCFNFTNTKNRSGLLSVLKRYIILLSHRDASVCPCICFVKTLLMASAHSWWEYHHAVFVFIEMNYSFVIEACSSSRAHNTLLVLLFLCGCIFMTWQHFTRIIWSLWYISSFCSCIQLLCRSNMNYTALFNRFRWHREMNFCFIFDVKEHDITNKTDDTNER